MSISRVGGSVHNGLVKGVDTGIVSIHYLLLTRLHYQFVPEHFLFAPVLSRRVELH